MSHIFFEIALIIVLAAVLGGIAARLKQPAVLGYILTGLIVGPAGFLRLNNPEAVDAFAQIGITFLLFLVGMDMRLKDLKQVGRTALLTGLGQIFFTAAIGFVIVRLLGYGAVAALYVSVALTFSSTIIVVKLLSEKHALDSLYGKITVGVLLVQDFVALGFLMLLSSLSSAGGAVVSLSPDQIGFTFVKGTLLLAAVLLCGKYVMPKLLHLAGRSHETLLLASLAWGMGLAALVALPQIGFTIEIGGFMAGVAIAGSYEHSQIVGRIKSLRDFFLVMFFVILGSKIVLSNLPMIWAPALVLSFFVLVGDPLIVLLIMSALGYRSRTAFMTSVTVAQVSEFSLILVNLGYKLGHVDGTVVSLVTLVAIVTILISSYMILYSDRLYALMEKFLKRFEFNVRGLEGAAPPHGLKNHIILVGCHRMGRSILESLEEMHKHFVVVDFNPDVIVHLRRRDIHAIYGDISDPEIQEQAGVGQARLIISTAPMHQDSMNLLKHLRRANPKAKLIFTAENEPDALLMYEHGADYVMLPHFIGGMQLAETIRGDANMRSLKVMRDQDLSIITSHP